MKRRVRIRLGRCAACQEEGWQEITCSPSGAQVITCSPCRCKGPEQYVPVLPAYAGRELAVPAAAATD